MCQCAERTYFFDILAHQDSVFLHAGTGQRIHPVGMNRLHCLMYIFRAKPTREYHRYSDRLLNAPVNRPVMRFASRTDSRYGFGDGIEDQNVRVGCAVFCVFDCGFILYADRLHQQYPRHPFIELLFEIRVAAVFRA